MKECNVAFLYWGRRGFSRFTLEAVRAARKIGLNACFSISTSNELYDEFRRFSDDIFPVDTFQSGSGAILNAGRILHLRSALVAWLAQRDVNCVIALMPHVWSPLISGVLRGQGVRYAVVMHDAKAHPGDPTGLVFDWLLQDVKRADVVVTLSRFVRSDLIRRQVAPPERIKSVLMPDLTFPLGRPEAATKSPRTETSGPLRILYFGRLLRYKGLPLFVNAVGDLIGNGCPVDISVCGEGNINPAIRARLESMGATITNRWMSDEEVGQLMACHDVMVLTHSEASQSGLISAAFAAGLPVVTTPVGGLVEQVLQRGGGLVAERADAKSIADCIRLLARDCTAYNDICARIGVSPRFSMEQFLRDLIATVGSGGVASSPIDVASTQLLPILDGTSVNLGELEPSRLNGQ